MTEFEDQTGFPWRDLGAWVEYPCFEVSRKNGVSFYCNLPSQHQYEMEARYGLGWAPALRAWLHGREKIGDPLPPEFEFTWPLLDKILGPK